MQDPNILDQSELTPNPVDTTEVDLSTMGATEQLTYGDNPEEHDELGADEWIQGLLNKETFTTGALKAEDNIRGNRDITEQPPNLGVKSMTTTQQNEGFRDKVYKDTLGFDTIGYGHKLTKEERTSGKFARGISKEQAQELYENDERLHTAGLVKNAPWVTNQPDEVQEVLKDMAFNMGPAFIKKWPIFAKQLQQGNYKAASENMLKSRYAKQVKGRAVRNAEKLANL